VNKIIIINDQEIKVESRAALVAIIDKFLKDDYSEVWIKGHEESSLCAMINPNNAFLMYLRYEGDTGFRSNNKSGHDNNTIEFRLSNGQSDHYPESWLTKKEKVKSALLTYFDGGGMDVNVDWIEEASR
jgi:hypothetical protein